MLKLYFSETPGEREKEQNVLKRRPAFLTSGVYCLAEYIDEFIALRNNDCCHFL